MSRYLTRADALLNTLPEDAIVVSEEHAMVIYEQGNKTYELMLYEIDNACSSCASMWIVRLSIQEK